MTDLKTACVEYVKVQDVDMIGLARYLIATEYGGFIPITAKAYDKIGRPVRGDIIAITMTIHEMRASEP